jgi:hypothetical protein
MNKEGRRSKDFSVATEPYIMACVSLNQNTIYFYLPSKWDWFYSVPSRDTRGQGVGGKEKRETPPPRM